MMDATPVACDHCACRRKECTGNVSGRCGSTDLISHDAETVAILSKPKHRLDEVRSMGRDHPAGAQDKMLGTADADRFFTHEF